MVDLGASCGWWFCIASFVVLLGGGPVLGGPGEDLVGVSCMALAMGKIFLDVTI